MEVPPMKDMKEFWYATLSIAGSDQYVHIYSNKDHQPVTFTILNFPVDNIDEAIDKLGSVGVSFEFLRNPEMPNKNDPRCIYTNWKYSDIKRNAHCRLQAVWRIGNKHSWR